MKFPKTFLLKEIAQIISVIKQNFKIEEKNGEFFVNDFQEKFRVNMNSR